MPIYISISQPKWTNGWLDGFKLRHNIKRYQQFSETGSSRSLEAEAHMEEIRVISQEYHPNDQFNMDEGAL
jgi:hypothetical protein